MTIQEIAKHYNVSESRIRNILVSNNIEIRNPHKKTKSTDTYVEDNIARFPNVIGKHYIAVSKIDGTEHEDYLNKGGYLTRHIKEKIDIEPLSLRKRKRYFIRTIQEYPFL